MEFKMVVNMLHLWKFKWTILANGITYVLHKVLNSHFNFPFNSPFNFPLYFPLYFLFTTFKYILYASFQTSISCGK